MQERSSRKVKTVLKGSSAISALKFGLALVFFTVFLVACPQPTPAPTPDPTVAAPTFVPASGATPVRMRDAELTINGPSGAVIRYNAGASDVVDPTTSGDTNGTTYDADMKPTFGALSPAGGALTVKAIAIVSGTSSTVAEATYMVAAPLPIADAPTVAPAAGAVANNAMLTITGGESGAMIRYTSGAADVADPTASGAGGTDYTIGTTTVALNSLVASTGSFPKTVIVKVIAFKPATHRPSPVVTRTYMVAGLPGTAVTFTSTAGTQDRSAMLTLGGGTTSGMIRYTSGAADGASPTASTGTVYTSSTQPTFGSLASMGGPVTVKAISFKSDTHAPSAEVMRTFNVRLPHPGLGLGAATGLDNDSMLSFTAIPANTKVYYTVSAMDGASTVNPDDPATPTAASTAYTPGAMIALDGLGGTADAAKVIELKVIVIHDTDTTAYPSSTVLDLTYGLNVE